MASMAVVRNIQGIVAAIDDICEVELFTTIRGFQGGRCIDRDRIGSCIGRIDQAKG